MMNSCWSVWSSFTLFSFVGIDFCGGSFCVCFFVSFSRIVTESICFLVVVVDSLIDGVVVVVVGFGSGSEFAGVVDGFDSIVGVSIDVGSGTGTGVDLTESGIKLFLFFGSDVSEED